MRILLIILMSFNVIGCGKLEIGRELDSGLEYEDKCDNNLSFLFYYIHTGLVGEARSRCYKGVHDDELSKEYSNVVVTSNPDYFILQNKQNNDCYLAAGSITCLDSRFFIEISLSEIYKISANSLIIVSSRFPGVQITPKRLSGWRDFESIDSVIHLGFDGQYHELKYPDFRFLVKK